MARGPDPLTDQVGTGQRVNRLAGTLLRLSEPLCADKRLGVTRGLHALGALYIFGELSNDRLWGADWCGCLAEKW